MESLKSGGSERPLSEAVEVKPELLWGHQDIGDSWIPGHLLRRAAGMGCSLSRRGSVCVAGNRAGRLALPSPVVPSWLYYELQKLGMSCGTSDSSCWGFGLTIPCYFLILSFWSTNSLTFCPYVLEVCNFVFYFIGFFRTEQNAFLYCKTIMNPWEQEVEGSGLRATWLGVYKG